MTHGGPGQVGPRHRPRASHAALEVRGYNQNTGRVRLRVSDVELAKLIQRVNA